MWDMTNIEESDNGCKSPETHLQQILYNQNCEQWLGQILGFCAQHTNNLLMGVYLGLVVNRMWAKDYPCFVAWCDGRVRDVPHFDHWHIYQRMSLNYSSRSDSIMQATFGAHACPRPTTNTNLCFYLPWKFRNSVPPSTRIILHRQRWCDGGI